MLAKMAENLFHSYDLDNNGRMGFKELSEVLKHLMKEAGLKVPCHMSNPGQ